MADDTSSSLHDRLAGIGADLIVEALAIVLRRRGLDPRGFPIVIRLFGAGEADSRAMVAGREHIHYVPRGTTLEEAVGLIVRLTS